MLAWQTYSERCHTAHAQAGEPLPLSVGHDSSEVEDLFLKNLNPLSVVSAENIDLTKLPVDIFEISIIIDIDNGQLEDVKFIWNL